MGPTIKVTGWAPDFDETQPGIVVDCESMEPSLRGMRAAPSATTVEPGDIGAECFGAALATKLDGTRRLIVGTATKLYEASGGAWLDRSTGTYGATVDNPWEFRQFGDVTIAVNGVNDPQTSTAGTFTSLTAMPVARLVETVAGFVMVANVTDASFAHPDGWWCSKLYDYTDWTPSIASQSANGRLFDTPGAINALRALGGDVVAFKATSMYLGRYVGPPLIWAWQQVPGDVGAFSQQGVVSDGQALFFWGGDNFYRFDGSRPQPIGEAVRRWFQDNASDLYLSRMRGHYDRRRSLVRWYYVPTGQTTLSGCISFNTRTGTWGRADRTVQALVDYVTSSATFDAPGSLGALAYTSTTFNEIYDSPLWTAATQTPAIVADDTIQVLTGVPGASSLTTGVMGDDETYTLLRRVRPRYATAPITATMTHYSAASSGTQMTERQTVIGSDAKFDVTHSARWHKMRFDMTGDVEVTSYALDAVPAGKR